MGRSPPKLDSLKSVPKNRHTLRFKLNVFARSQWQNIECKGWEEALFFPFEVGKTSESPFSRQSVSNNFILGQLW